MWLGPDVTQSLVDLVAVPALRGSAPGRPVVPALFVRVGHMGRRGGGLGGQRDLQGRHP